MANISKITDRLFTGGDLPSHRGDDAMITDLRDIVASGITHIVDCRLEWDDKAFLATHAPDIGYLHNGADDAGQRMPDAWFDEGVGFALEALRQPDAVVLAHCHMGINRGPSMAYAILLATGHDPVEALDAIRRARPVAAIAYAYDALRWWLRRSGASEDDSRTAEEQVRRWFDEHPIDIVRIIRDQHALEAAEAAQRRGVA